MSGQQMGNKLNIGAWAKVTELGICLKVSSVERAINKIYYMSEQLCLLCKQRKVYHIKSHLTPAGITENMYGVRDEEEIYTIDPTKKEVDTYYGPAHPQKESTVVKIAPNVRKGIFCKICENNFGVYEAAVQDKLNELINAIGNEMSIKKSAYQTKFVEIDIHPNVLITFFEGVVWRQCLEQQLDGQDCPLDKAEMEKLRLLVLENSNLSVKDIVKKDLTANPMMSIFTTYHTKDRKTPSYGNPSPKNTNPLLFFIGLIVLLYSVPGQTTPGFCQETDVDEDLLRDEFTLRHGLLSVVNEGPWKRIHKHVAKAVAKQYNRH
jgi:hypothetical protein